MEHLTITKNGKSDSVIDAVTKVTGVSRSAQISKSRKWPHVEARMLSILVYYHRLGMIDEDIALILVRGRSNICKVRHTAQNLLEMSSTFKAKYQKVQSIINSNNNEQ